MRSRRQCPWLNQNCTANSVYALWHAGSWASLSEDKRTLCLGQRDSAVISWWGVLLNGPAVGIGHKSLRFIGAFGFRSSFFVQVAGGSWVQEVLLLAWPSDHGSQQERGRRAPSVLVPTPSVVGRCWGGWMAVPWFCFLTTAGLLQRLLSTLVVGGPKRVQSDSFVGYR